MYMCIFRVTFLCIIIVYYSSASIHLVTSTTGLPTVMSTSGINDAESNTTIIIATSLSVIILVLIIVSSVLAIITKIHKNSGALVILNYNSYQWKLYCSSFRIYWTSTTTTN